MNTQRGASQCKESRIPFNKPPFFQEKFTQAIHAANSHGKFSGDGINTRACLNFFKQHYGYDRALLTPSCTASLEMAALILDLGPGDEVIVPAFTFVTSANAFALRGVNLIFADSEKHQPNVSVSDILNKVTDKTKAIVVVHYAGVPVDVKQIKQETNNCIDIIEDCAHAIDTMDPNIDDHIGKQGCMSTFSFHETKNIGIGEGGLLVVNRPELWRKAQIIREKGTNRTDFSAGKVAFYTWVDLGSSYLMSDINAAMLWSALQNIGQIQDTRLALWDAYDQELVCPSNCVFKKPSRTLRGNAHMYFLVFNDHEVRTEFCQTMKNKNILVATHYVPLDSSPFVLERRNQGLISDGEPCVEAERWSSSLVRLPLFCDLSYEEIHRVTSAVNEFALSKAEIRQTDADGDNCTAVRVRNQSPHIVLLLATRRGLLFLQKVNELMPSARLTVFSFQEDDNEPPFLESIRSCTEAAGGELHVARKVGLEKHSRLWANLASKDGGIDIMFCVGWRFMVEPNIYLLPHRGTFVFHDSLLPRYRGFAPTVWAIVQGEERTGVSLMTIADDVDSGDLVDQVEVAIAPEDTISTVMERVTQKYLDMLEKNLPTLLTGSFKAVPQEQTLATYTVKRTPLDNLIRWERSADECYNLVRAITRPYPGAVTYLEGRKYIVWAADRSDRRHVEVNAPGRVVSFGPDGIAVLCGDGRLLRLTRLMGEDGKELSGESLVHQSVFKLSSTFSDRIN